MCTFLFLVKPESVLKTQIMSGKKKLLVKCGGVGYN